MSAVGAEEFLTAEFREASRSRLFLHGFLSERGREGMISAFHRIAMTFRDLLKRNRAVPAP